MHGQVVRTAKEAARERHDYRPYGIRNETGVTVSVRSSTIYGETKWPLVLKQGEHRRFALHDWRDLERKVSAQGLHLALPPVSENSPDFGGRLWHAIRARRPGSERQAPPPVDDL